MQQPTSPYIRTPYRPSHSWFWIQQQLRDLRFRPGAGSNDGHLAPARVLWLGLALVMVLAPWPLEAATLHPLPYFLGSGLDASMAESFAVETTETVSEKGRRMTLALRVDSAFGRPARWDRSVGSAVAVAYEPEHRRLWLATSAHVVPCKEGCRILVDLPTQDGRTVTGKARVRWQDVRRDLALLSARVPERGQFELARQSKLNPARPSPVTALGFPGTAPSSEKTERPLAVTHGIVVERHAARRLVFRSSTAMEAQGTFELDHLVFHTAAIDPGSSGGPLLDAEGALLGIHTGSLVKGNGDCLQAPGEPMCLHLAVEMEALWQELDRLLPRRPHARTPLAD